MPKARILDVLVTDTVWGIRYGKTANSPQRWAIFEYDEASPEGVTASVKNGTGRCVSIDGESYFLSVGQYINSKRTVVVRKLSFQPPPPGILGEEYAARWRKNGSSPAAGGVKLVSPKAKSHRQKDTDK